MWRNEVEWVWIDAWWPQEGHQAASDQSPPPPLTNAPEWKMVSWQWKGTR